MLFFSVSHITLYYCMLYTTMLLCYFIYIDISSVYSNHVAGCPVGDAGLASLGNNPNFRNIAISGCKQITDVGIQKMCSKLLLLETLDISNCVNITDYATKFLAFSCREIVRLNMSGCVQVR